MESLYDEALDSPAPEVQEENIDNETYGLLYRGYLSDTISIGEHQVVMRTLKIGEELEAALVADKWKDSHESGRALATALVAASIVTVDGQALTESLGPKQSDIEAKFTFIRNNWYWVTVQTLYKKYDELLLQALEKYDLVKKD